MYNEDTISVISRVNFLCSVGHQFTFLMTQEKNTVLLKCKTKKYTTQVLELMYNSFDVKLYLTCSAILLKIVTLYHVV